MENAQREESIDAQLSRALDDSDRHVSETPLVAKRKALIDAFQQEALERADPFAAIAGYDTGVLMQVYGEVAAAVEQELEAAHPTIEDIRALSPEFTLLVKLRNAISLDLVLQNEHENVNARITPETRKRLTSGRVRNLRAERRRDL
jgi:hypothetical protein